jgi:subtilisin family serine protease
MFKRLSNLLPIFVCISLLLNGAAIAERPRIKEGSVIISRVSSTEEIARRHKTWIELIEPAFARLHEVSQLRNKFLFINAKRSRKRSLTASTKRDLCNDRRIKHILSLIQCEPDFIVNAYINSPNDPFYQSEEQWNLNSSSEFDIDAPEAWDISRGSKSVLVGIIDSGIVRNHPDLASNLWVNPQEIADDGIDNDSNGVIDDINGLNAIQNSGDVDDENGHGSHVAGIIGAVGNDSTGIVGVNWQVGIITAKFLDANGSGFTSNAIKSLNYCN